VNYYKNFTQEKKGASSTKVHKHNIEPEPGPLELRRYLVHSCVVRAMPVPVCGRWGGGTVEGRYEEKTEAPLIF
jgi:hypothetical protein